MNKKKECPSCAMEIDSKSKFCPVCGYEFTSTGGRKWIAVFLLALILLAILYRLM
jgi:predicted amidophosphoribosyltransferase